MNNNNNNNNNNANNNNNENTNANMKRKRKRRSLKATEEAMKAARDDDKGLVEHLIERPLTDAALATEVLRLFLHDWTLDY